MWKNKNQVSREMFYHPSKQFEASKNWCKKMMLKLITFNFLLIWSLWPVAPAWIFSGRIEVLKWWAYKGVASSWVRGRGTLPLDAGDVFKDYPKINEKIQFKAKFFQFLMKICNFSEKSSKIFLVFSKIWLKYWKT